jgi:signal transduction histidine kinase
MKQRVFSMAPRDKRLLLYVLLGVLAGATYVGFDLYAEAHLETGTLTGTWASAHTLVDHLLPLLLGGLLGVAVRHVEVRARLSAAEEAASRAEALRVRLQKIERDQAVWLLVATVLHELNNPLQAIALLLDEHEAGGVDAARKADLAGRARIQANRAIQHLANLRSMRGLSEPDFQRVSLQGIAEVLANDMGSLSEASGVAVRAECGEGVEASADPAYVRTILENLLDNSVHSLRAAGGGTVTIRLAKEPGRAIVSVEDDGPPFDVTARDSLFDPLRSTKTHGLGLGLPIARALARAMRGELVLADAGRKAFRLELPLHAGDVS